MPPAVDTPPKSDRPLALRRRRDLQIVPQTFSGVRVWAIKDPVRLQYFHLTEEEYSVLCGLDGATSLTELQQRFEQEFAPRRIGIHQIQSFLSMLHREGLILADGPGQAAELLRRADKKRWRQRAASLSNLLALRFRGFDPQRLLDWLAPVGRRLLSWPALLASLLLVLCTLTLVLGHPDVLWSRWPDTRALLTPATALWFSTALAISKILHELGHALTCRKYGRECHEMGLLLLVFTPCLYCNVSDAWMLENKWQRAAISAAGVFVEVTLAAVCALLWWFSEPGLFNTLCFHLMVVCSVNTLLLNGNPLLRYDGYFILADLVEIPNLSQQAAQVALDWFAAIVLGLPPDAVDQPGRVRRTLLGIYALASLAYRVAITLGVLWLVHQVLKPYRLEALTALLVLIVVGGLLAGSCQRGWQFIRLRWRDRPMPHHPRLVRPAVIVALLLGGLLVPLPHRIGAPAVIDAGQATPVYVTVPGRVVSTAAVGTTIESREPVAVLENMDLELEVVRLRGQCQEQQLKLDNLKRRQTVEAGTAALIPTAEKSLADLEDRLARLEDEQARLIVQAPIAGTILPVRRKPQRYATGELESWSGLPLDPENRGSTLETGTLLCQIGNPAQFEAWLILDQRDMDFVRVGQAVRLQLEQSPGRELTGTIQDISELDLQVTPVELLPDGAVPTRTDESGVQRPVSTTYQARVLLDRTDARLLVGEVGQARILTDPQSLASRVARFLNHTFRFEL